MTAPSNRSKKPREPAAAPAVLGMIAAESPAEWEKWLAENHECSPGVWLRFYKKKSGVKSVTYPEALDGALCHGWIDGQMKSFDVDSYVQKFTPRRAKS